MSKPVDVTDLEKIRDALAASLIFFQHRDEMNAEVHLAREVRYSPLTSRVAAELERLDTIIHG